MTLKVEYKKLYDHGSIVKGSLRVMVNGEHFGTLKRASVDEWCWRWAECPDNPWVPGAQSKRDATVALLLCGWGNSKEVWDWLKVVGDE